MQIRSIQDVAAAVRGRRTDLGVNQADLARRVGVSRKWIYEFEAGKPTAEFGIVMRVLEELDLILDLHTAAGDDAARPSSGAVDLDALLDEHRAQ